MATLTTDWQVLSEKTITPGMFLQTIARYTSQSVSGNYSNVDVQLRIRMGNAAVHCYTHSCNFNGGTFDASDYKGSYYHGWEAYTTTTILSQSKTIYHNNNGDGSFTLGGYFTCSAGVSGSVDSVACYLPHINRLSVFSVDKPNFNVGDTLNVSVTKYVSGYTNNLYMVIGNTEHLIQSNVGSSVQIETSLLANYLYQAMPNAKTYSNVFRLYTYSGGTTLGNTTKNYTATASNSNPTFDVAYQDTNSSTIAITSDNQKIIQNKSTLQINITNASVTHYAGGLTSASVTINNQTTNISLSGTTGVSANINVGAVNLSQNTNAVVRVTDSRGNYLEKTLSLTIIPYATPSAEVFLKRKLNYYTQTDIKVDSTYSSLDGQNTISIVYRIKKTTDSTWGDYATLTDGTLTTFNADNRYAWDVEILLQDLLEPRVIQKILPAGQPPLYVDVYKNSVGINCFPENSGSLEINGKTIFDLLYPVGSIFTYDSSTNPSTIFGGTWVQVECHEVIQSGTLTGTNLNRGYYRIYANGDFDAWGESNTLASQPTGTAYNMTATLPFTPATWVITPGFGQCGDWSGCDVMSVYGSGYIGIYVWNGTGYTKTQIISNFMCKGTLNLASNNIATLYSWKRTN